MRKQKISIVLSPQLLEEINCRVSERGRSRFIEQALENELKRVKREQLIDAYRESAKEAEQENQFFEGVSGDGLS
jgi:metal-responsive CopG/Arc/MetJ family transcriptional regulator